MIKTVVVVIVLGVVLIGGGLYIKAKPFSKPNTPEITGLRYVAVGDSYTVGTGVKPSEVWTSLLADELSSNGVKTTLVANLARSADTTQNAIDSQLPTFEQEKPDFGTLLIGVNDLIQGVDSATFRSNVATLMGRMAAVLPRQDHLLVVTIPDFALTPAGQNLAHGHGDELSAATASFNAIIREEADGRGIKVVDIFELSEQVKTDSSLVATDGLHPSAKQYALWEKLIYPAARELLH